MAFTVPDSSPPSTPDKSRSLTSNPSTTPAGHPPSSAASFTPQGAPLSTEFGSSRIGSRSKLNFSESAFSQSGKFDGSDSIFSSFSSNYPLSKTTNGKPAQSFGSQSFFSATNTSQFDGFGSRGHNLSRMSEQTEDYEDEGEEEYEDEDEEEADDGMDVEHTKGFSESGFGLPHTQFGQQKMIYSNPKNAKRAKLDEHWATSSPAVTKIKLGPRKKPSLMPSIVRDLASRSGPAAVTEPSDLILQTEERIGEMIDRSREIEFSHLDLDVIITETSTALTEIWDLCADKQREAAGSYRPHSGIGPEEGAKGIEKASFLASLLLPLYWPPLVHVGAGTSRSSAIHTASRSLVLSGPDAKTYVPTPKVLIDWLNANHAPPTDEIQDLRAVSPNPTASPDFWDITQAAVLRGRFAEVAELLRSADFNYARSALEDGLTQPGYRGAQLQNIQKLVNKAIQLLGSSPLVQYDDWDMTGVEWAAYRKRVTSALSELEEFTEGQDSQLSQPPVSDAPRFHAVNFGLSQDPSAAQTDFFAQSLRMAESRIPWSIYQSLKGMYGIILGETTAITTNSQDWVEATVGLTAWWDGEDDSEAFGHSMNGFGVSTTSNKGTRARLQMPRSIDANPRDTYLRRLDYNFGAVTDDASGDTGFQPNSLNSIEVGLACVFEGNIEGVLQLLQTWSLCIASSVAEVVSQGGRLETSVAAKSLAGFLSENDLMVLSYAQDGNAAGVRLRKDDILIPYAEGLFKRPQLSNDRGTREGWELTLEVLSRLNDAAVMKKKVTELLEKLPVDTIDQVEKVVLLCTDLGLESEGRKTSENFGQKLIDEGKDFGLAMICFARAHSRTRVKMVTDLLIAYSLTYSCAFPPDEKLDKQLRTLLREPKTCLSAIASIDSKAASILQFYASGYATLRRFYETRDEAISAKDDKVTRFKPQARKRVAAEALVAVIRSAADSIYGGLYDPDRDSAVSVDGLLILLGEALAFVDELKAPVLNVSQQSAILSAIEDLETVAPRVYAQCEEVFRSALAKYRKEQGTASPTSPSFALVPSPRALLKKSVSSLTASSSFSMIGSEILESEGHPGSASGSGVLVPRPGEDAIPIKRAWDWRASLPEDTKAEDVLRILRLGLAKGMSFAALG